ncbi:hypothetical protein AGMMS49525_11390 [Bacteroidia bacterium]|nr:hypothetical protein AGMMS49525_11390 [Bacteroidia bacterium]
MATAGTITVNGTATATAGPVHTSIDVTYTNGGNISLNAVAGMASDTYAGVVSPTSHKFLTAMQGALPASADLCVLRYGTNTKYVSGKMCYWRGSSNVALLTTALGNCAGRGLRLASGPEAMHLLSLTGAIAPPVDTHYWTSAIWHNVAGSYVEFIQAWLSDTGVRTSHGIRSADNNWGLNAPPASGDGLATALCVGEI